MKKESAKDFFDAWSVYDHVLDCNYMFHDEVFREVADLLRERFDGRPFALLDLGCGSARHITAALRGTSVEFYSGVDLSEEALNHARENLEALECAAELLKGNFLEALAVEGEDKFDIIFSSYALHHLKTPEKERFFELAYRKLVPGGTLLLIDTAQEEHEDRESSLAAYCQWIESDWKSLPPKAKNLVYDHILKFDYPEKGSVMQRLAMRTGFPTGREKYISNWHRTWCFESDIQPMR